MKKNLKIMCVNAGSSSLKFKLFLVDEKVENVTKIIDKSKYLVPLTSGNVERIGHQDAIFTIKKGDEKKEEIKPILNHAEAVKLVLDNLISFGIVSSLSEIGGVGHRIVQGGAYFSASHILDKDTENKIAELIPLDPLHAEAHLTCFHAFKDALPSNVKHVAVFDTAYHQSMEADEYMYALPYEYYEKYKVRKYGAHGTSHNYLALVATEKYLKNKKNVNIITCHIGSGASLAAIKNGKVVSTSMGLTPLAGVMMGTRTGDIDASCMSYLCKCLNVDAEEMFSIFNHKSGLLGISGVSNDTRDIEEAVKKNNDRAILASKMFARYIADYIMMYYGKLDGKVDLIVCSAGVFENSSYYREKTFELLKKSLGIKINKTLNKQMVKGNEGIISDSDSSIPVVVLPTNEELMIALDTLNFVK